VTFECFSQDRGRDRFTAPGLAGNTDGIPAGPGLNLGQNVIDDLSTDLKVMFFNINNIALHRGLPCSISALQLVSISACQHFSLSALQLLADRLTG
jgi:hypothetical protein